MKDKTRDIKLVIKEQVLPEGRARHGLVIGIDEYGGSEFDLNCAANDAKLIESIMVDPGCGLFLERDVTVLLNGDATERRIKLEIHELSRRARAGDAVWIYFAGHAEQVSGDVFWVASDSKHDALNVTGVPLHWVRQQMASMSADQKVMILDCCHAAGGTLRKDKVRSVLSPRAMLDQLKGAGSLTLCSSDLGQKSVEMSDKGHGAFTYYLAEGLRGRADADGDGVVTHDELCAYLAERVTHEAKQRSVDQTPIFQSDVSGAIGMSLSPETRSTKEAALRRRIESWRSYLSPEGLQLCLDLLDRQPETKTEEGIRNELRDLGRGTKFSALLGVSVEQALREAEGPGPGVIAELDDGQSAPVRPAVFPDATDLGAIAATQVDLPVFEECMQAVEERRPLSEVVAWRAPEDLASWRAAAPRSAQAMWLSGICEREGWGCDQDRFSARARFQRAADSGLAAGQADLARCFSEGIGTAPSVVAAIDWFHKAANQGYKPAFRPLGALLLVDGPHQDIARGLTWLRKAAKGHDPEAEWMLGTAYRDGLGPRKNRRSALSWLQRAAEGGLAKAMVDLGRLHLEGKLSGTSKLEAEDWIRKAADSGHPDGQLELFLLLRGTDISEPEELQDLLKGAAAGGAVEAQLRLGLCYLEGDLFRKNRPKAREWFEQAADQGDVRAQLALAKQLEDGDGVEPDPDRAGYWYRQAADRGSDEAMCRLGHLLSSKAGDEYAKECFAWYAKAADMGNQDAALWIGIAHAEGKWTERNHEEAERWLTPLAESGEALACSWLAEILLEKRRTKRVMETALAYLRDAALKGEPRAQLLLGSCYEDGVGVLKDAKRARHYYSRAAKAGLDEARLGLESLEQAGGQHRRRVSGDEPRGMLARLLRSLFPRN